MFRADAAAGRWISALLASLWLWSAVAYHFVFFSGINPEARATRRSTFRARFIGYASGGHVWVGHHKEGSEQIVAFLRSR